jgi:hypothetical protein
MAKILVCDSCSEPMIETDYDDVWTCANPECSEWEIPVLEDGTYFALQSY